MSLYLDSQNFQQCVDSSNLTVIKWTAVWCGPCKMIQPFIEELENKYSNVTFVSIDVDEEQGLAEQYKISSIPSFYFFKDGKLLSSFNGANKDKLVKMVETYRN